MWVPLVSHGRLIGMLSVANSRHCAYGPRNAELALVVGLLAVITMMTAFTDQMSEFHHVAVPVAATVMFIAWALELAT